jgi:hypothetical protein
MTLKKALAKTGKARREDWQEGSYLTINDGLTEDFEENVLIYFDSDENDFTYPKLWVDDLVADDYQPVREGEIC